MKLLSKQTGILFLWISFLWIISCSPDNRNNEETKTDESKPFDSIHLAKQSQHGIYVPEGFEVSLFAEETGRGRHLVVSESGVVYVLLRQPNNEGCLVALKDTDSDGKADEKEYFGEHCGRGSVEIHKGYLYFSTDSSILRLPLPEEGLIPSGDPEVIAEGFEYHGQHGNKNFAFDNAGNLYVNSGAPANACQEQMRTPGSSGQDPCPILERFGGVWKFKDDVPNQKQMEEGERFTTGVRNLVAINFNPAVNKLYAVQHGRDQLHQFFPELYTAKESSELPAEEFILMEEGDDFGWPYCYYDPFKDKKVLAPEYGGDGDSVGRCADKKDPILDFPGHYAPNDLEFYTASQFPDMYKNGAFIAFHGSWNRGEFGQEGFNVVFVPFDGELPIGKWYVFADGFDGGGKIQGAGDAEYRPTGVTVGPDGSLFVIDSKKGRIWKISYKENMS